MRSWWLEWYEVCQENMLPEKSVNKSKPEEWSSEICITQLGHFESDSEHAHTGFASTEPWPLRGDCFCTEGRVISCCHSLSLTDLPRLHSQYSPESCISYQTVVSPAARLKPGNDAQTWHKKYCCMLGLIEKIPCIFLYTAHALGF